MDSENKFTPETKKKIDRILQTIRRVRLSSDTDLEFLSLQIINASNGYQITSTRFFNDVLRILAGSISITDFQLRTQYTESPSIADFSPLVKKAFINDMVTFYKKNASLGFNEKTTEKLQKVVDAHLIKNLISADELAVIFNINDLEIKNFSALKFIEEKQMVLNGTDMLFFMQVKEISNIKEKFEFSGKSNIIKAKNSYALLLKTSYIKDIKNFKITGIYRLKKSLDKKDSLFVFPKEFESVSDYTKWNDDMFWIEDMNVEIMLSRQIAKRAANVLNKESKRETEITGLLDKNRQPKFIINDDKKEYNDIIQVLNEQLFIVSKKYDFFKFKTMSFFDNNNELIKKQDIDKKIFKSRGILHEAFGKRKY